MIYAKLAGAAILVLLLWWAYSHYQHLASEAAKVPALEKQIEENDAKAMVLADLLKITDEARQKADANLTRALNNRAAILEEIRKAGRNATAATNPICFPSDADRKLRNDGLAKILGFGLDRAPAVLPNSSGENDRGGSPANIRPE